MAIKNIDDIKEMFGLDTSPIVGLDLGASGVKIMSLVKDNENIKVASYAIVPLDPGAIVERNILKIEEVTSAIKMAIHKAKVTTKKTSLALGSAMSITRVVEFGKELNDKEIGEEITMSSDRYIPYPLHEVNMDYQVIGPNATSNDLVDVLLVATKKEIVDNLTEIIEDTGLKPEVVNLDCYALGGAFELVYNKLPNSGKDKVIAIFDVGATSTNFIVMRNKRVIYTRDQAFGSQQLIDEVQNNYGLDYSEALTAIKYEDLPKDYETEILEPFKLTVAQQVNRSCEFFYSAGDYKTVDYIFITGGCSTLLGIDVAIQQKLGIKTFIANPFAEIILDPSIDAKEFKYDSARLMMCCGLALRNIV